MGALAPAILKIGLLAPRNFGTIYYCQHPLAPVNGPIYCQHPQFKSRPLTYELFTTIFHEFTISKFLITANQSWLTQIVNRIFWNYIGWIRNSRSMSFLLLEAEWKFKVLCANMHTFAHQFCNCVCTFLALNLLYEPWKTRLTSWVLSLSE